jgi:uncharacterized membrane protein YhaH (DUF805 family)
MNWYIEAWKKYGVFSERTGRQGYWYFALFHILVYILLSIIAGVIGGKVGGSLLSLYTLAVTIPAWAATVRRLHDTNRSGSCFWFSWRKRVMRLRISTARFHRLPLRHPNKFLQATESLERGSIQPRPKGCRHYQVIDYVHL